MGTIRVDIDTDEVLDALSDKEIANEFQRRRLFQKDEPDAREVVVRAVNMIKLGRVTDGVTLLEREFLPRWKDRAACEEAYRLAVGRAS
ncbi:hypothetical protein [Shinella sp. BYT-45]|uniref:hypothetical protein n=1 Tax=Shinella sp. BYT-45 TaxID=3377377 RepID=UPI003980AE6B